MLQPESFIHLTMDDDLETDKKFFREIPLALWVADIM